MYLAQIRKKQYNKGMKTKYSLFKSYSRCMTGLIGDQVKVTLYLSQFNGFCCSMLGPVVFICDGGIMTASQYSLNLIDTRSSFERVRNIVLTRNILDAWMLWSLKNEK